jgi:Ca2+-binding RTX toxin-like protein
MIFNGTPGPDTFVGGASADTIYGVAGNDQLFGGGGADSIDGGDGDDTISSGPDVSSFSKYSLSPPLDRGVEVDTLVGGNGSDRLFAGYGDNVDGGANGSFGDYLYISFQGAPSGVTADFGLATQTIGGGVITGIENLSYVEGSNFNDNLNVRDLSGGYTEFTVVHGMGGNDTLTAGYYTDDLYGDDGDDLVDGRLSQYLTRVDGGPGNDTLYSGGPSNGAAYGGPGNDVIYAKGIAHGDAGNDTITMDANVFGGPGYGDDGNDHLIGGDHGNYMAGGAGADTLDGGGGADSLYSADYVSASVNPAPDMGLEHDVLSGGGGDDFLAIGYGDDADGGAGTDTLYLSLGGLSHGVQLDAAGIVGAGPFNLGGGVIQNMESLLYLRGSEFNDTLTAPTQTGLATIDAGAGDDVVRARSSGVWVLGGAGDDRFVGGPAADHFDGGAGNDTLDFSGSSAGVTINLAAGTGGDGDTYVNVEAVLGSSLADTLVAGVGSILHGGAGADSLAGAGNASAYGDDGDDQLSGGSGGGYLFGGAGNDKLTGGGSAASDLYGEDGNDTLTAGVNGDRLLGGVGADHLSAGAVNAILDGGQGDDVLDGGSGAGTADYEGASGGVSVDLRISGAQAVGADQGTDTLINIEKVTGGGFNDSLHGDAHANTLQGGGGDDTLIGGAGDDVLDGGVGVNTVSYAEATGAVTVSLVAPGPQSIGGGEGVDTLSHIQNLTGSAFGDMLYGDAQANILVGGGGNDTLQGGAGNDTFDGGAGADQFVATESGGVDWVIGWEQADTLHTGSVAATGANYVESTAADDASALALATARIQAGASYVAVAVGANVQVYSDSLGLHTGASLGEVVIQGRTLADISAANFVGGAAPPAPGAPPPPVINGSTGLFSGNMEALHLGSLIGDAITAATSTTLTLQAPGVNLTLFGTGFTYDGNQQINGGSVTTILYTAPGWNLNLQVPHIPAASFGGWVASDATAFAFQNIFALNDKLGGTTGADVIHSYGGDDVLYGAGGGDSLYGGDGNDQIFADYPLDMSGATGGGRSYLRGENGDDTILGGSGFDDINGNRGNDTIDGGSGGGDWLVGGQGDDLITAHASQNILYGNLGDDTLNAGSGGDLMRGGQGNDLITGGAGNDWISGDRGNDTVSGGAGADTFHTFSGAGRDRVLDFHIGEGDRVQVDAGTTYTVTQIGADTIIDMGGGDQMILVGVQMSTLTGGWIFTL